MGVGNDSEIEILESVGKESWLEKTLAMPGAISSIFFISILLPWIGWSREITWALMVAFSIPTVYYFVIAIILNRDIRLRKHLPFMLLLSFLAYLISVVPSTPQVLYVHIFLFFVGLGISTITYFIYYALYKLGKKMWGTEEIMYRKRLLVAFLPTLGIMLFIMLIIGSLPIGLEGETVIVWFNGIVGGL